MNNKIIVKENDFLQEKYYYTKHKSGLAVYVFPKQLSTSYAVFGTKYGSIDNVFKLSNESEYTVVPDGIAHFLEHKMFENEDGEDTFKKFSRTGASANAYTSFSNTVYLFSCTNNFYESLEILLDYVTHPYFTPDNVQKEQGIISQEIRMYEDNPDNVLMYDLLKAMYEKHPVRTEITGTIGSISEITDEILYKCYNTFYNLSNMVLCVSGDIDPEKVLEVADKILTEQPEVIIERIYADELPSVVKPYVTRKMQVAKPLFAIGVKDVNISESGFERIKKSAAISILDSILFGRSSKFYNELYEEGLISNSFGCWDLQKQSFSFISISGESNEPEKVFERFKKYIAEVKITGINEDDFNRCKKANYANAVKSFDSTDEIANNFLTYVFDDEDIFTQIESINTIDIKYITELFSDIYKDEHYSLATVFPIENEIGSDLNNG